MPSLRDREDKSTVELEISFTGSETELAYQIIDGDGVMHWIPLSQTVERHGKLGGGPGTIVIYEWLAKKKGLI